jgi:hypothetical protein
MKQIAQIDPDNLDAIYLGAGVNDLEDSNKLKSKIDSAFLNSHKTCKEYKDLDVKKSFLVGYTMLESGLSATDNHIIRAGTKVIDGNYEKNINQGYRYYAGRSGFYLAGCNVAVKCTSFATSDLVSYWGDNPFTLEMYKNNATYMPPVISPTSAFDPPSTYYPIFHYGCSGVWGVYLNPGDYIDFRVNLLNKSTPDPCNFVIAASVFVNCVGVETEVGVAI